MISKFADLLIDDKIFAIEKNKVKGPNSMHSHHLHDHYEIFYLLSGERDYFIHDRIYKAKKGNILLIKPNELHRTVGAGNSEYERILIDFKHIFLAGMEKSMQDLIYCFYLDSNSIMLSNEDQFAIEHLFSKLLYEYENPTTHSVLYSKLLLTELLILLNRYSDKSKKAVFEFPNDSHKKISDVIQYINVNYAHKLSLDIISQHFFISQYYFCHLFKEVIGISFMHYVNIVRINEAQRLLKETDMSITSILEATGFDNNSHFGRVFKQLTGISPLKYRKLNYCSLKPFQH